MMIQISYYPGAEDKLDIIASDPAWFEEVNSPEKAVEALGRLERLIENKKRELELISGHNTF